MPYLPVIARAGLHYWEEPCISGKNGSGTVFFSGCSVKCCYCQNYQISFENFGKTQTVEQLIDIFKDLEMLGANNINLVTPTHYTHIIKKALDAYKPNIPIVYNSSGYDSVEEIEKLKDYIDIFLVDLKYLSSEKSLKYSKAEDYPNVATKFIEYCTTLQPKNLLNDRGIMQKGVIVRHLILPQGTNEAIKVIDWVEKNTPDVFLSLMSQYTPCGNIGEFKELNRQITNREYQKVLSYAVGKNIAEIFTQDIKSSSKKFIPAFDLSGTK